jgi:hypothetical protein
MNTRWIAILLVGAFFCVSLLNAQSFLRNGSFESFTSGDPNEWKTSNIPTLLTLVSATPEAHSGKTGLKFEVKSFYGTRMCGMATQEDIRTAATHLKLSGYYQLKSVGGDKVLASVTLYDSEGRIVHIQDETLDPTTSFKPFTLGVEAESDVSVATAKVCFSIVRGKNDEFHEGTIGVLDDVMLVTQPRRDIIGQQR